jgi:hypothetical protein
MMSKKWIAVISLLIVNLIASATISFAFERLPILI